MSSFNSIVQDKVNNLCNLLYSEMAIKIFYYSRIFDEKHCLVLSNKPDWVSYKLEKKYTIFAPLNACLAGNRYYQLVPDFGSALHNQVMNDGRKLFKIFNPFDMLFYNQNYYELFSFATDYNRPDIANHYLNNISKLEKFIFYFKANVDFIIEAKDVEIIEIKHPYQIPIPKEKGNVKLKKNFCDHISNVGFIFNVNGENIKFSPRELECIRQIAKGCTMKMTAKNLKSSPRTVETYLNNIKNKLNCSKGKIISVLEKDVYFNILISS